MNMPTISVLMPVYNVEAYIGEAVESILAQTFADFELIILDDCSTDKTSDIVTTFSDSRIRYIKQPRNLGLSENLNTGIRMARGKYIARMDGDDIAVNTWLEKGKCVLDNNPDIGICSSGFEWFGSKKATVRFPKYNEDIKAQLLYNNAVIVPIIRTEVLIDNNLFYKTEAFPAEDYRMWAECIRATKIYNIQETLFYYRMHEKQICAARRDEQKNKVNEVRLFMLEYLNPNISDEDKDYFINNFAENKINSRKDIALLKKFARKLIEKNTTNKNFDEKALHRCFKKNIGISAYNFSINLFFSSGYSVGKYISFLKSMLFVHIPLKYNIRILYKTLF